MVCGYPFTQDNIGQTTELMTIICMAIELINLSGALTVSSNSLMMACFYRSQCTRKVGCDYLRNPR
jgi:hypothetical protein